MKIKPESPPMRKLQGYTWVNEWELVDWYTSLGMLYPRKSAYSDRFSWFSRLFKRDYQIKLEYSLELNKKIYEEYKRLGLK
jgi:hypothetical protein